MVLIWNCGPTSTLTNDCGRYTIKKCTMDPAMSHTLILGCNEMTDTFIPKPAEWSAFRSSDYGYARLKVHNKTHLHLEQVSDDKDGQVIDQIWLIKHSHGPYSLV
ncbi:hypothetical protein LSTR_LSTR005098 [Laodelphax striatellus]|uniref:Purple acid phosphatase C-terminal domain-containing protein n=1 Tax=Laodelphax striatellus TaxID=195883 RepID=A0A482WRB1_LAOST|nr:hypothetical protein LSTR_LSTR005098 [Laodelphax striatellus]